MAKYQIKPFQVDAVQYTCIPGEYPYSETIPNWLREKFIDGTIHVRMNDETGLDELDIMTPLGIVTGRSTDYIVRGTNGDIFPWAEHIFTQHYEFLSNVSDYGSLDYIEDTQLELFEGE